MIKTGEKMKKFFSVFFLTIILISSSNIYSQHFPKDKECYIFVNSARIRNKPDIKSNVTDLLELGHKVKITKEESKTLNLYGIKANWCKISYQKSGKRKTGYIWSGLLSLETIPYKDKLIIFGLITYKKGDFITSIKIISENKTISEAKFRIKYYYSKEAVNFPKYELKIYDNLGYDKFENVIKIHLLNIPAYEMKDRNIIVLNNNKIKHLGTEYFQSEGAVFSFRKIYIFPNEKDGINNTIIYVHRETKFDETTSKDIVTKFKKLKYKWENDKLVIVK